MRLAEATTDAQVAAAKTGVHVSTTKPTPVSAAEAAHVGAAEAAAHVGAAEAAAHVTAAKSPTTARVSGIGAEAAA
jgi:hypothetical protein